MTCVSICIPTYNRREYLKDTLDSIFAQTYKDYEVVIVDDGSTDGTEQMIKQSCHPVRYYKQQNKGEPAARNKLIEIAGGKYITFIDSDDILFPYAVEELVKLVNSNDSDVVAYGSYVGIDEKGSEVGRKPHKPLPSGKIAADLFEYIHVHSCGTLCSRKMLEEAGGFDQSLPVCSPYALWLKLSLKYDFIPAARPIFKRRRHHGNLSAYSFTNRTIELNVLDHAYRNGFGSGGGVISPHRAMKRLSREGYRAGRCAIREGLSPIACMLLKRSFFQYPNFKSFLWWSIAYGSSLFNHHNPDTCKSFESYTGSHS
jgi:glycosyltransferase involved in cell wall biosynthesis